MFEGDALEEEIVGFRAPRSADEDRAGGASEGSAERPRNICGNVRLDSDRVTGRPVISLSPSVEAGPSVGAPNAYLVDRGFQVMGHVGLRPQAVNVDGKFRAKGRTRLIDNIPV